jgi:hypothetical protein
MAMDQPGACECTHGRGAISRRSLLAASMSAVVGGAVLSSSVCSSETGQMPPPALPENALITLGVQAGPPPVPNRTGIASALKIGSDVYQIDCGVQPLVGDWIIGSQPGGHDVVGAGRIPGEMLLERDQQHGTSAVGRHNLTCVGAS